MAACPQWDQSPGIRDLVEAGNRATLYQRTASKRSWLRSRNTCHQVRIVHCDPNLWDHWRNLDQAYRSICHQQIDARFHNHFLWWNLEIGFTAIYLEFTTLVRPTTWQIIYQLEIILAFNLSSQIIDQVNLGFNRQVVLTMPWHNLRPCNLPSLLFLANRCCNRQ